LFSEHDLCGELAGMRRTGRRNDTVARGEPPTRLDQLLEASLRIDPVAALAGGHRQLDLQLTPHEGARRAQPPIEIDRGEDGFERVGEQGRLGATAGRVFAAPEDEGTAET